MTVRRDAVRSQMPVVASIVPKEQSDAVRSVLAESGGEQFCAMCGLVMGKNLIEAAPPPGKCKLHSQRELAVRGSQHPAKP